MQIYAQAVPQAQSWTGVQWAVTQQFYALHHHAALWRKYEEYIYLFIYYNCMYAAVILSKILSKSKNKKLPIHVGGYLQKYIWRIKINSK